MNISNAKRLKELELENTRLNKLLAESMLENEVTREALQFQSVSCLDHKKISTLTLARRVIDAGSAWLHCLHQKDAVAFLHGQVH